MSINIERKTDKVIEATIKDEEGVIDLSNVTLTWRFWNNGEVIIKKSTEDGSIEKVNSENGEIGMKLNSNDTDISGGKYKYEILIEDVEGNKYLPNKGVLTINSNKTAEV